MEQVPSASPEAAAERWNRRTAPVSAPMGTSGEAIPLPPLERLATYDPERDMPGIMELRDKYNDGDYVKVEDVRNWHAPHAERIRLLEQDNGLLSLIADQFKARLASADERIRHLERELERIANYQAPAHRCADDADLDDVCGIALAALDCASGKRCVHGVWAADHCYQCASGEPV